MKACTAEDRRNLAGDLRDLWFPSLILCGEDEPFLDAAKIFAKFMGGTFAVLRGKNHPAAFAAKDEVCDAKFGTLASTHLPLTTSALRSPRTSRENRP